jgi:hypothetical protein
VGLVGSKVQTFQVLHTRNPKSKQEGISPERWHVYNRIRANLQIYAMSRLLALAFDIKAY